MAKVYVIVAGEDGDIIGVATSLKRAKQLVKEYIEDEPSDDITEEWGLNTDALTYTYDDGIHYLDDDINLTYDVHIVERETNKEAW